MTEQFLYHLLERTDWSLPLLCFYVMAYIHSIATYGAPTIYTGIRFPVTRLYADCWGEGVTR